MFFCNPNSTTITDKEMQTIQKLVKQVKEVLVKSQLHDEYKVSHLPYVPPCNNNVMYTVPAQSYEYPQQSYQPVYYYVTQPQDQYCAQPCVQPVAQPCVQPVAQPVVQPVAQPVVQPCTQTCVQPQVVYDIPMMQSYYPVFYNNYAFAQPTQPTQPTQFTQSPQPSQPAQPVEDPAKMSQPVQEPLQRSEHQVQLQHENLRIDIGKLQQQLEQTVYESMMQVFRQLDPQVMYQLYPQVMPKVLNEVFTQVLPQIVEQSYTL